MNFLTEYWAEILLIAQTAARLTPTKRDDLIMSKIGKMLNTVFLKSRER